MVIRSNHTINLTLDLITTQAIISPSPSGQISSKLGQIKPNSIGAIYGQSNPNPLSFNNSMDFSHAYSIIGEGDTAEVSLIRASLSASGDIKISAVFNTAKQLAANTKIHLNISVPMKYTDMADDFCDKFYWKRTA